MIKDKFNQKKKTQYQILLEILSRRYGECNNEGHIKVNKNEDYCNYCYRHLKYNSEKIDLIRDSRKDLSMIHQPLDASFLVEKEREEINHKKHLDVLNGLAKLAIELRIV